MRGNAAPIAGGQYRHTGSPSVAKAMKMKSTRDQQSLNLNTQRNDSGSRLITNSQDRGIPTYK